MDKETLSNYGWIVIAVLVLVVMIALATPFGSFVSEAVQSTTKGLFDVNKSALDSTGLINIDNQEFDVPDMNHGAGNGGNVEGETPATPEPVELKTFSIQSLNGTILNTFTFEEGMTWEEFLNSDYNAPDVKGACFKLYAYGSHNNTIGYYNGSGWSNVHDNINSSYPELSTEQIIANNNYVIAADGDLISGGHQGGSND